MGVITLSDVNYGHIFGPYPTHVSLADPAYLIGLLTCDNRPEGGMLKVSLYIDVACYQKYCLFILRIIFNYNYS